MGSIDQRAIHTLAWLGKSDESGDWAMELMKKLGGRQEDLGLFQRPGGCWVGPQYKTYYGVQWEDIEADNVLRDYLSTLDLIGPEDLSEDN